MQNYRNGSTVKCKYSAEFRRLVYKVNPHDLSCMYKRMFELCATNALRDFEATEILKKMASEFGLFDHTLGMPVEPERPQISKSMTARLTLLSDASISSSSLLSAETNVKTKHIKGWETCHRSSMSLSDHRSSGADGLEKVKSRSMSALGKLECSGKDDRIRHARAYSTRCRKATSSEVIANRVAEMVPSVSGTAPYTSIYSFTNIPYDFKHYDDVDNYMEQYRERYTYKRLETMRPNLTGIRPYQLTLPVSPLLRCFDVFGSGQPRPRVTRMSISSMQAAGFCPKGRTSPKKQFMKKIIKSTSPVLRTYRQSSSIIAAENGILKMEFQGQSVHKVLATSSAQTPPSGRSSRNLFSAPNLTSVSVNDVKIPVVCRSRPTIPSNAHGAIYSSSTETPTYVVSYQKNK